MKAGVGKKSMFVKHARTEGAYQRTKQVFSRPRKHEQVVPSFLMAEAI